MEHTIDAQGRPVGRIATEVALILSGKNTPAYERNRVPDILVRVENASKMNVSPKKMEQKTYTRYTGHPGGLRTETMEEVVAKKGYGEVLRRAVYGMLPNNKLRPVMMKHLVVTE